MAAETGFIIDNVRYEAPALDTFTMDEAQVLYDYSGLVIEDFVPLVKPAPPVVDDPKVQAAYEQAIAWRNEAMEELLVKVRNPGFMRALMHVAYQREHPELASARVKAIISSADYTDNFAALLDADLEEADAGDPPASTTEQEPSSKSGSVDSNETSGTDSTRSSEEPADPDEPTMTGGSDTSLASHPVSSAR